MVFEMQLKPRDLRNFLRHPLQPGDEIDLEVNEASIKDAMRYILQYGVEANPSTVIRWYVLRTSAMTVAGSRRVHPAEPYNTDNWDTVDKNAEPEHLLPRR